MLIDYLDLFALEGLVWIAEAKIKLPCYDFAFDRHFNCQRPEDRPDPVIAVGRFGVAPNYFDTYRQLLETKAVKLIHSPEENRLASELPNWYPLISDLTPRSRWYREIPDIAEIEAHFNWPIFIKGSRQTNHHQAELSIIHSAQEYCQAVEHYRKEPMLSWQQFVCREYIPLRPIADYIETGMIPPSFEFRTFGWYGRYVGAGHYWHPVATYQWTEAEEKAAVAVARQAAHRLKLPFLVIDIAQTVDGQWIVIECNDGQESGYAGTSPLALWQNIINESGQSN